MAKTKTKTRIKKLRARVRRLADRVAALEAPKGIPGSRRYKGLVNAIIRLATRVWGSLQ